MVAPLQNAGEAEMPGRASVKGLAGYFHLNTVEDGPVEGQVRLGKIPVIEGLCEGWGAQER